MENPWKKLDETKDGSIVADEDKTAIGHLRFSHLPQPYMGDPSRAKIFMLYGSPSVPDDMGGLSQSDFNRDHKKFILNSLDFDSSENRKKDYPLYALDPAFEKYSIYKWWSNRLRHLITKSGLASKIVSEKLFVAQYFPYFLENPDVNDIPILKSQKYIFNLVEEAIEAEKTILIVNNRNEWYNAIANLTTYRKDTEGKEYSRVIHLVVPVGANLTRDTIEPGGFDRILRLLHSPSNNS